jgi:ABC-2 type transport system ATP-binding protein
MNGTGNRGGTHNSDERHVDSAPDTTTDADSPVVSVQNLVKTYGDVRAVDGVSFELEKGTAVGILGPNGAGKTTTIKCMLGLIIPTAGETEVAGFDVTEQQEQVYHHIGATFEGARNMYWRLTVMENLDFFAAIAGHDPRERQERHAELLEQFNISDKAETVVRELSRGQKQKAALACTLARDADFLFLDEPTLGLDIESSLELRRELRSLVEEEDTTVLVSSHNMDVIEDVCDRVIIMNDGQVVADDSVENLLSLFETTTYTFTVRERLPGDLKDILRAKFNVSDFESVGDNVRFRVTVSGEAFYELIDFLRDAFLTIESIEPVDVDLEEAFLELTDTDIGDDAADDHEPDGVDETQRPLEVIGGGDD